MCVFKHVQEMVGLFCNMGAELGFQKRLGRTTVAYRESRSEKIKNYRKIRSIKSVASPPILCEACLQERCACDHNGVS